MLPKWLTVLLAPYAAVKRDGAAFAAAVENHLRDARVENLQQLAFVLMRPEILRARRGAELLHHLASVYAAAPVALRIARLSKQQVQSLYLLRLPFWEDRIWLHEDLFDTGPCAVMLLHGLPGTPGSLSRRLDTAKGPTAFPDEAAPDSLRSRFGRPSSIHACLHVSSDEGALLHEAGQFFPWRVIRAALDAPVTLPSAPCRTLLDCEPHARATVFEALLSVKLRIYAALELSKSGLPPRVAARLRRKASVQLRSLAGLPPLQQRSALATFACQERPVLADLIEQAHSSAAECFQSANFPRDFSVRDIWATTRAANDIVELLYAAWFLAGNESLDPGQVETIIRLLDQSNVPVSGWLQTLIQAGCAVDLRHP